MDDGFYRVITEIRPFLMPYLEEQGIKFDSRNFTRCINTDHNDSDPSMHLIPDTDNQLLYCFGCGACYNIFHAARELEDKEDRGTGFLTDTIPYLAEKFGVPFDKESLKLSEEALIKYRYQQLYNDAAAVLKEIGEYEHTTERHWNTEVCKEHGIASVSWEQFLTRLRNRGGYDVDEIKAKGIHPGLFGSTLITFTIRDWRGKVCGFVARNTKYNKAIKSTYPKFRNTSDEVPIYNKSRLLYGLEVAALQPEKRLDIFEGYGDWVCAMTRGYRNCAAMGGVALTKEHLEIVSEIGFTHINMIFDGDSTGQTKMEGYLDRYAGAVEGLRVTVMQLPFSEEVIPENRDPDTYFKSNTVKDYLKIQPMTAFDWRLRTKVLKIKEKISEAGFEGEAAKSKEAWSLVKDDLRMISKEMIPFIMAETSAIEQGRMCNSLATSCGVREEDIRAELKSRSNRQVNDISQSLQRRLKNARDSQEVIEIIDNSKAQIEKAITKKDYSKFHPKECLSDLDSFFQDCDIETEEITGWRTGWNTFDDPNVLGGIPKKGSIITIAGPPNHGKTAILVNLCKQLVLPEQNNDNLSTLFWSLDDPRHVTWSKILASMTSFPILDVRKPYNSILMQNEKKKKAYYGWRDYLRHCVASKKLLLKGQEIGNDLSSLEYWIKETQDSTGNDVVLFVDAVHDMTTGTGSDNDPRIRYMKIYDWVQATTEQDDYSFVTCAHITKAGMAKGKPEQSDLSETAKILFASKMICMAYSELDGLTAIHRRDDALLYWIDPDEHSYLDSKKPIIEVNITKNKEAAFKGSLWFKHKSNACYLEPLTPEEVIRIRDKNGASGETTEVNIAQPETLSVTNLDFDFGDISSSEI